MEVDYAYSVYLCGMKRADERTRTADLLITSRPLPHSLPLVNTLFCRFFSGSCSCLYAEYRPVSPLLLPLLLPGRLQPFTMSLADNVF